MKKRAVTLLTLLAVSANLMACGGSDATESSAENDAEQIEAEVTAQTENADTEEEEVLPEGKYRSELTNELIDDSLKDQRPIAVMVQRIHCTSTLWLVTCRCGIRDDEQHAERTYHTIHGAV